MNTIEEFQQELIALINTRNGYESVLKELCDLIGVSTDKPDYLEDLLDEFHNLVSGAKGGVNHDTQKVIDMTINAVHRQLDDVHCYKEEPYLDVNDYTNEVSIQLYGLDDTFRLDAEEVSLCVQEELNPKEEEPKEEVSADEQADAENVSEETIKENTDE